MSSNKRQQAQNSDDSDDKPPQKIAKTAPAWTTEGVLGVYKAFLQKLHISEKDIFITEDDLAKRLLQDDDGLGEFLYGAAMALDAAAIRNHPLLRVSGMVPSTSNSSSNSGISVDKDDVLMSDTGVKEATMKSWKSQYIDRDIVRGFKRHIDENWRLASLYARFLALVQSSGVGKSKLMDEISKEDYTMPVCLRDPDAPGYPPSDIAPYELFLSTRIEDSQLMALCFLLALFTRAAEWFEEHDNSKPADLREFMTEGQTMDGHGQGRVEFYDQVCVKAKELFGSFGDGGYAERLRSAKGLVGAKASALVDSFPMARTTARKSSIRKQRIKHGVENYKLPAYPSLYLVFDEAHTLTVAQRDTSKTHYTELRRALQALNDVGILTVFMSTTGAISQLASSTRLDPSTRLQHNEFTLMPPWTTFSWDHLWQSSKVGVGRTITDLTAMENVVNFGRPLWGLRFKNGDVNVRRTIVQFAAIKLLGRSNWDTVSFDPALYFACLAQRMCLELNSTVYQQRVAEEDAVQNHLRICMKVNEDRESLVTTSPSEPIVSEAASLIMKTNPNFHMVDGLKAILAGFGLDQGDRGELVAMALFTEARDLAIEKEHLREGSDLRQYLPTFSVPQFLNHLLHRKELGSDMPSLVRNNAENISFNQQFKDSIMHFNHFIQPHQHKVFTTRRLHPSFIARGAALRGAKGQPGSDFAFFFLRSGPTVEEKNSSLILAQLKNVQGMSSIPDKSLFHLMCPYRLGIFKENEDPPGPIIRLVFSLASRKPCVTRVEYSVEERKEHCKVTTYDYFVAGLDPSVLVPITEGEKKAWKAVLRESPWSNMYANAPASDSLRKQAPLAMVQKAHLSFFK